MKKHIKTIILSLSTFGAMTATTATLTNSLIQSSSISNTSSEYEISSKAASTSLPQSDNSTASITLPGNVVGSFSYPGTICSSNTTTLLTLDVGLRLLDNATGNVIDLTLADSIDESNDLYNGPELSKSILSCYYDAAGKMYVLLYSRNDTDLGVMVVDEENHTISENTYVSFPPGSSGLNVKQFKAVELKSLDNYSYVGIFPTNVKADYISTVPYLQIMRLARNTKSWDNFTKVLLDVSNDDAAQSRNAYLNGVAGQIDSSNMENCRLCFTFGDDSSNHAYNVDVYKPWSITWDDNKNENGRIKCRLLGETIVENARSEFTPEVAASQYEKMNGNMIVSDTSSTRATVLCPLFDDNNNITVASGVMNDKKGSQAGISVATGFSNAVNVFTQRDYKDNTAAAVSLKKDGSVDIWKYNFNNSNEPQKINVNILSKYINVNKTMLSLSPDSRYLFAMERDTKNLWIVDTTNNSYEAGVTGGFTYPVFAKTVSLKTTSLPFKDLGNQTYPSAIGNDTAPFDKDESIQKLLYDSSSKLINGAYPTGPDFNASCFQISWTDRNNPEQLQVCFTIKYANVTSKEFVLTVTGFDPKLSSNVGQGNMGHNNIGPNGLVDGSTTSDSGMSWWVYLSIGLSAAVLICIIVTIVVVIKKSKQKVVTRYITKPGAGGPKQLGYSQHPGLQGPNMPNRGPGQGQPGKLGPSGGQPGKLGPNASNIPSAKTPMSNMQQPRPATPGARPGVGAQRPGMNRTNTPPPPKVEINAPPKSLAPKRK